MNISRNVTNTIRFVLDELLPPILRDSRFFMTLPMKVVLKNNANVVINFKSKVPFMTDEEMAAVYRDGDWFTDGRETDINEGCIEKTKKSIKGKTVLDAGCGAGYLSKLLAQKYAVTGVDFAIPSGLRKKIPEVKFIEAPIEKLPFKHNAFDTVVCAHTIEHVRNITPVMQELRRVTKKRLIIITPCQRPYKYTFDLHLQFFPTPESLLLAVNSRHKVSCEVIEGDLFLIEDYE
jgi:SAM-dependent methyltransferase